MAKKYLTQEEAADQLGIAVAELNSLRERGEIRGFSDRGTWKFRAEDVDELNRTRQATSDPDIPMLAEFAVGNDVDEDEFGSQKTAIREASVFDDDGPGGPGPSDSDVRLIVDAGIRVERDHDEDVSDSDVQIVGRSSVDRGDSDSDVRLAGVETVAFDDGDSDVRLLPVDEGNSDSDVRLVKSDSDSDVRLTPAADSDSDVKIVPGGDAVGSDSDVKLIGSGIHAAGDSDVKLIGSDIVDAGGPGSDSDVALVAADGSGLLLDVADDASSVFADDSPAPGGSSLVAPGSGLFGPDDSGINLESLGSGAVGGGGEASGITLAGDEDDILLGDGSSITFADESSGIALETDELDRTMPEVDVVSGDEADRTDHEVAAVRDDDEGETFNLALDDDADAASPFADSGARPGARKGAAAAPAPSSSGSATFDLAAEAGADEGEGEAFDDFEDSFDDGEEYEDDEELEVAADIEGEDDELDDLDAFDEGEDFDDEFEAGGLAAPRGRGMQPPAAREWGAWTFAGLACTLLFMSFGGMLAYDLVRSMWAYDGNAAVGSGLLQWFARTIAG